MGDDQFQTSGNWWDSTRNRFESGASQSSNVLAWQQPDMVVLDMKPRSSMDNSMSASGTSSMVFHNTQKLQPPDSSPADHPNLHMMGLGLSSQPLDNWNHHQAPLTLLRGEKAAESNFGSMLQENTSFQQFFSADSTSNEFKQVNRGFSLDQPHEFSPQYSSGDSTVTSNFQMAADSSALYGSPSILQGLLGSPSDHHHHHNNQTQNQQASFDQNRPIMNSFPYQQVSTANYGLNNSSHELLPPCSSSNWSKVPQFLRSSPPKQNQQLHFTNNAPFWNSSDQPASIKDVRSSFYSSLQQPFPTTNFDVQSKNISQVRESSGGGVKKSVNEAAASKRPRNETASPLPAFKVRKEKMGDRITALQQLVSPFGKTDTASVLSEAIEYIKFLHEQVTVLSTPYMKSGAPIQHQQNSGKCKESDQGPKQDLRNRGLCLVPVSSTFPVTHETTVDFWTPTFGGSFR
ncbi:transcription factor bHLH [Quillaja saponaria]|uniref:Transcription factor bHLH n=1 Tax=Quillaja saponaria TaxID=32244 RepID=A0AAD7KZ07_QUISA|nr:transcription factor bHLH [Quillaja saponaria]